MRSAGWMIRVASRPEVGGGHVSRARALAGALAAKARVTLVLDDQGMHWKAALAAQGLDAVGVGELPVCPWVGCVVDSYDLAAEEFTELRGRTGFLAVIDDFLDPPACADLVVNGALHLAGNSVKGCPALLGPRYALLDPAFRRQASRPVRKAVERVFLTFGARDSRNGVQLALDALALLNGGGFQPEVSIALGRRAPHLAAIRARLLSLPFQSTLLLDAANMADLFRAADLAIVGGGVSLLECIACGTPPIGIIVASNQAAAMMGAAKRGAAVLGGVVDELEPQQLAEIIRHIVADTDRRRTLVSRGCELVDGLGAQRVAEALLAARPQRVV